MFDVQRDVTIRAIDAKTAVAAATEGHSSDPGLARYCSVSRMCA